MTKYVEWDEPYDGEQDPPHVLLRMTIEDAVRAMRRKDKYNQYQSDEQALDDFIVIHWARIVEC